MDFLKLVTTCIFLILYCAGSSEAYTFKVGGKDGWTLNPSVSYSHWAGRLRFQVNDTLSFTYPKASDSVLVVSKDDYDKCNVDKPITKFEDGNSVFNFDRSGPFYFISGNKKNCDRGQKLIVVVLAIRTPLKPPLAPSPSPAAKPPAPASNVPAPSPSSNGPVVSPTPAPSPSPASNVPAPSPSSNGPVVSPAPAPSPASNVPAPSPSSKGPVVSPAPASSPASNVPGLSPSSNGPAASPPPGATPVTPTSSPPPGTPATLPPPGTPAPSTSGTIPGNVTSPPAPAGSFSPAVTPSVIMVSLVLTVAVGSFIASH